VSISAHCDSQDRQSSTPTNESTEAERQKIIDAIFAEANELKQKLEGKSKQHEPFSFEI
jgi:hypothetical protein